MFLAATGNSISVPDSLLLSLFGFLVVFIALVALIAVIKVLSLLSERGKAVTPVDNAQLDSEQLVNDQPEEIIHTPAAAGMVAAAGSLGEIDLYDVDDQSAALIMAIVADQMKVPLNTLRFKSIKLIDEV